MGIDLEPVQRLVAHEHGLATVSVVRADGTPHSSLVNAGLVVHPVTGRLVVGYVTYGQVKLRALRVRPGTSLLWRAGWQWVAVDGPSELIGPDDPHEAFDDEALRLLLRAVFVGAGGTHDDWDTYDQVMREQRRAAVLIEPAKVYSNA